MKILNNYFRPSDNTSYIHFKDGDDREFLTNGIIIWQEGLNKKIANLIPDHEDFNLNHVYENLRKYHRYSSITKFLENMNKGDIS